MFALLLMRYAHAKPRNGKRRREWGEGHTFDEAIFGRFDNGVGGLRNWAAAAEVGPAGIISGKATVGLSHFNAVKLAFQWPIGGENIFRDKTKWHNICLMVIISTTV
ncbi:hypothetical protein niasHT_021326 [Heterodera trifolii]|uniref:Uncharacterized protein n=2 Tax=Heterodera TaxID=34509 RepID=A0ABD2K6F5_9BILA